MLAKKIAPAFHHVVNVKSSIKIFLFENNTWVTFLGLPNKVLLVCTHVALLWLVIMSLLMMNITGASDRRLTCTSYHGGPKLQAVF